MNLSKTPNEINFPLPPVCKNCHKILFDIPIKHILELRANEIIDKFLIYTNIDLETDSTIYKQRFGIVEVNNE